MSNVLIYNKSFFPISETFVYQQVLYVKDEFETTLLGHSILHRDNFPLNGVNVKLLTKINTPVSQLTDKVKAKLGLKVQLTSKELAEATDQISASNAKLVHVHFGFNAVKLLPAVKKLQLPLIVSFHGIDASPVIAKRKSYLAALPDLLDYCKTIIVSSMHMVDVLGLTDRQKNKVVLFPYGVDAEKFRAVEQTSDRSFVRILHSGRLVPKKGVPDLVKTFARVASKYPHVQLDIVGNGVEMTPVKKIVDETNLAGRINLHGEQSHVNVQRFINDADIFVLNSRTAKDGDMEGSPVSILEAMSMGKGVISTRHAGIPELINDGVNGLIVDERNNDALFEALERLINDTDLRQRLGESARETVEARYSGTQMKTRFIEIYKEALS